MARGTDVRRANKSRTPADLCLYIQAKIFLSRNFQVINVTPIMATSVFVFIGPGLDVSLALTVATVLTSHNVVQSCSLTNLPRMAWSWEVQRIRMQWTGLKNYAFWSAAGDQLVVQWNLLLAVVTSANQHC